jgi:hypothetical protein
MIASGRLERMLDAFEKFTLEPFARIVDPGKLTDAAM